MGQTSNAGTGRLTALTSPTHFLDDRQRLFVENIVKGRGVEAAARIAGYAHPHSAGRSVLGNPKIQNAIRYLYKKHEKVIDMDRKKVMDGFLEAIEMAKLQADAGNMVAGWREIAKMCGYYAPEIKKIEISVSAQRVIGQLEVLSDDDLLKMVEESAQIIEGEASNILEDLQRHDEAVASGTAEDTAGECGEDTGETRSEARGRETAAA